MLTLYTQSTISQQYFAKKMIESGMTTVWAHIEDELHRRRLNSVWLARKLDASRQVISGWKVRGVPAGRYQEIADVFGWTIDRLVNGLPDDTLQPEPANEPELGLSPIALDVARLFDSIPDELHRARAYAFVMQLSKGHAPPVDSPPTRPAIAPVAPEQSTTAKPRTVK